MAKSITHKITSHEIVLMPQTPDRPEMFGWIRLKENDADAGYVYLTSQPKEPRLGGENDYIVTSVPFNSLGTMLEVLKSAPNLQIRFHDPESAGAPPNVFINTTHSAGGATDFGDAEFK